MSRLECFTTGDGGFIHYKLPMFLLSLARDDRSGKNPVLHGGFLFVDFLERKRLLFVSSAT